ncbi:MAG TPA: hypothetical protein VF062_13140 [Candidatus Limnocylindrales bacterium]
MPSRRAADPSSPGHGGGRPFTIYLAPQGNDASSRLTLADAVAGLERAEQVLAAANPGMDVEIRIANGEYVAGTNDWRTYVGGHTISFLPLNYTHAGSLPLGGRPVFRSDGRPGYWMWAAVPFGHPGRHRAATRGNVRP